jgi:hypothetical protein
MPTIKKDTSFRKKKRRTSKKQNENRVWMFRKRNVVICSRSPIIQQIIGGANEPTTDEKAKVILGQLRAALNTRAIKEFLMNNEEMLIKKLVDSPPKNDAVAAELNSSSPNISKNEEAKAELVKWVEKRYAARQMLNKVIEEAKANGDKLTEEEISNIEKTLNHESLNDIRGKISSMSSSAFDAISKGSVALGSFLTPPKINPIQTLQNETTIQLRWYPRTNNNYRKGRSTANPKLKYGDFMIYIEPERYADTITYLSENANSVEDLFAGVLDGCSDAFCMKGKPVREPYKKQVMTIINKQPQFDLEESMNPVLEIK